ncbi:MAG: type II toxin-antitoxin system RelE/ParE family toxin [Candidatus Hydrothermarchaeaceae archaeon]
MKTYKVLLNPKAYGELKSLPVELSVRIKDGLKNLRKDPYKARSGADIKPLHGTSSPRLYRLRVGDYRAIYWVDEKNSEVLVEKIAPRRKAYD